MRVVPFSGICLVLSHHYCSRSTPAVTFHPLYNVILERLPFKKLFIDLRCNWGECKYCPALEVMRKILQNFCGVLEELSLTIRWDGLELILPHLLEWFQNCSFPRLKVLDVEAEGTHENFPKFVKALINLAPNLQELRTPWDKNLNENVLQGSSAVLVPDSGGFNPLYEPVCESLVGAVRATILEIERVPDEEFNPELFNRLIPMMLQASRTTLKTLQMDVLFAVPLMCYGICLENVTTLEIYPDDGLLERLSPGLLKLLKGFDFTRVFPKLTGVQIENGHPRFFSPAQIRAFVGRGNDVLKKASADCAINIKQLTLLSSVSDTTAAFLAQMFPDVETLTVHIGRNTRRIPFTINWDHFQRIEQLDVAYTGWQHPVGNLDSVICGIFPEEVSELREKDDEYLQAVNIVPVMPSITCMKDLKNFTFLYNPRPNKSSPDPNFMFSKVTGLIAFTRCPDLAVVFRTPTRQQNAEALSHMKQFASLTTVDFETDDEYGY